MANYWPAIQVYNFGTREQCKQRLKQDPAEYKVLKHVSVVCYWGEVMQAWGLDGGYWDGEVPLCLHCRDFGLHRWCRCIIRVEIKLNAARYSDLFCAKKKGRPSAKVLQARNRDRLKRSNVWPRVAER